MGEGLRGQGGHGQGDGAEHGSPSRRGAHSADGARAALLVLAVLGAGCGGGAGAAPAFTDPHSRPIGRGAAYHPSPRSAPVAAARPVQGLRCDAGGSGRFGVHLGIFVGAMVLAANCGSGAGPAVPTIPAARTFHLVNFEPRGPIAPGTARLEYTVYDDSGRSREEVRVYGAKLALLAVIRDPLEPADGGIDSVRWPVPKALKARQLRFCVVAIDAAGNQSQASCAALQIR